MDALNLFLDELSADPPATRTELHRRKRTAASRWRTAMLRNDALLARYRQEVGAGRRSPDQRLERVLQLNHIRSSSGIATVTVITEPFPCPGRCVYCPTEARAPKSYLPNEPAILRAIRNDYDPYRQVTSRLEALHQTGHPTDKIELIVKGGTWSFYPAAYQEEFIARCFQAANEFSRGASPSASLETAQAANETAAHRLVGVTIETRPDYVSAEEIRRFRRLGVTRVELGVQSLDDRILQLIVRDHGTAEVAAATAMLRDASFKVAYHLMPNLPGATPEDDVATFRELFANPAYRPDTMKIYPCVVTETAELHAWYREGCYRPYADEELVELLIRLKQLVPAYVRIERVIRDIPSGSILAGCTFINLREEVQRRMRTRGLGCRCIRCREIRDAAGGDARLVRRDYDAAGGREVFLSFEDVAADRLAALLRLRIPPKDRALFPVLAGAALVRELHTYGLHVPLRARQGDAAQHHGFGRRLMETAERIAREEFGCPRIAVIAGVGVRAYYRSLGYTDDDTYMVKSLA